MSRHTLFSATTFSLSLLASSAIADVTPEQVWADWKGYMQGFGYEVTGAEARSGDTLTVSGISMAVSFPDGNFSMAVPDLGFTQLSGGKVSVDLPEEMPAEFSATSPDGETVRGTLLYKQEAPKLIVSGDPGDMSYTYSAQSFSATMDGLDTPAKDGATGAMNMAFAMSDVAGTTHMKVGALRNFESTMSAAQARYEIAFSDTSNNDSFTVTGASDTVSFSGTGSIPLAMDIDPENPSALFSAGFDVEGGFELGAGTMSFEAQSPDGPMKSTSSSSSTTFKVAMSGEGLRYEAAQKDSNIAMEAGPLPFPLTISMAQSGFNLAIPLQKSDMPQDFSFGLTLGDFTMSDMLWSLFDPGASLPRDPATIDLDLAGKVKILLDLFNPVDIEAAGPDATPGELHALDIRNVLVRAVGAEVSGNGAFSFDNSDTVTFEGMPRPKGKLNVSVSGANGLLDKLVAMGLLPQEQAMGARMMMGLFGVPGSSPDTLTSVVEVNDEGHVLANGQRLR